MRILCLLDFPVGSRKWLWDYLPPDEDEVDFLCHPANNHLRQRSKLLAYSFACTMQASEAWSRMRTKRYDMVVAWETKNGFLSAVLRRLLVRRDPRFVILAFGLRGLPLRLAQLARYATQAVDAITVPSTGEVEAYARKLGFPKERIYVCPNGAHDMFGDRATALADSDSDSLPYVFAGGYSYRDFGTLVEAAEGLHAQVRIVSPNMPPSISPGSNVKWIKTLPYHQYLSTMVNAKVVVIPLRNMPFATGLMELVSAMGAGKAIVATRTIATVDYIDSFQNGILVDPGDSGQMREAIAYLSARPAEAERIACNARQTYLARYTFTSFAARVREVLKEVSSGSGAA